MWEIVIKAQKGKGIGMPPPDEIPDFLSQETARLGAPVIPVTPPHVFALLKLPAIR